MFWIFLLVAGTSAVFVRLGSVSVWASVFSFGLKLALLVIALMIIVFFWIHFKDKILIETNNLSKKIQKYKR